MKPQNDIMQWKIDQHDTVQLIERHGRLYYPTGRWEDPTQPAMLFVRDEDVSICPWPMTRDKHRYLLASALFDERECNPTFDHNAIILLPDGATFDIDAELYAAEANR